jgi:hypothetical protein
MRKIKEGILLVTSSVDGHVIGQDHFRVVEKPSRIDLFTRQVLYDHVLEPDWTPRRVDVRKAGSAVGFRFEGDHVTMEIKRTIDETIALEFPVADRKRALVLTQPIYSVPVHVLNRLDPDDPNPQWFDVVPSGQCMIQAAGRVASMKGRRRAFDMHIVAPGLERQVRLLVDDTENLISYSFEQEQLSVSMRASLPAC